MNLNWISEVRVSDVVRSETPGYITDDKSKSSIRECVYWQKKGTIYLMKSSKDNSKLNHQRTLSLSSRTLLQLSHCNAAVTNQTLAD